MFRQAFCLVSRCLLFTESKSLQSKWRGGLMGASGYTKIQISLKKVKRLSGVKEWQRGFFAKNRFGQMCRFCFIRCKMWLLNYVPKTIQTKQQKDRNQWTNILYWLINKKTDSQEINKKLSTNGRFVVWGILGVLNPFHLRGCRTSNHWTPNHQFNLTH